MNLDDKITCFIIPRGQIIKCLITKRKLSFRFVFKREKFIVPSTSDNGRRGKSFQYSCHILRTLSENVAYGRRRR